MWSHLILLLRARRALRGGRYEAALAHLDDPLIREDRRAVELRRDILGRMVDRAKKRHKSGHHELALKDCRRLLELEPDLAGVAELEAEIHSVAEARDAERERGEGLLAAFERALSDGRLAEARHALEELNGAVSKDEHERHAERLAERRKQASQALRKAREALDRGLDREARGAVDEARRLCADSLAFRERLVGLSAAWAKERWVEVQRALAAGQNLEAARALSEWWESDPESDELAEARDLQLSVADRLAAEARELAGSGRFEEARELLSQVPGPIARVPVVRRLRELLGQLHELLSAHEDDPRRRAQGLARILAETRWKPLEDKLSELRKSAAELDARLARARETLAKGDVPKGKAELEDILATSPGCDEARALLDGLLADERERAEQLKAAREAMREGRLLEAERHLFRLVSGGHGAEEARALLRDVERLRAKVSREAQSLMHRVQAGADPDEVLDSVKRVQRSQSDSPELAAVETLALRRKARVEREQRFQRGLTRRDASLCLSALREWVAEGGEGGLDHDDRARLEQLGHDLQEAVQEELQRGDPAFVLELAGGVRPWQQQLGIDLESALDTAAARVDKARHLATDGLLAIEAKQVDRGRDLLEQARNAAPNEPEVLRLAHRLRHIDRNRERLEGALELASTDRAGAREQLASMGPTPRPLGSLVLQIKESVDRSGDLEGGCLLQVEEAGEYLVFTDERLRIGNATGQSFPQIPVLARIRGHHATLRRKVSFHGGVHDHVDAIEDAKVLLNGGATERRLQHGDRLELGGILPIQYLRPSPRSTSALLRLEKGFESRGTSRILWVKQGGKDGRVIIGRGKEVHVRVPHAEAELFLFSPGRNRLSVHFAGVGTIDGEEFSGDRELSSGSHVTCGKIQFRVLPLS